jgi:hypothetical protein
MARATRPDRKKADFWEHQRPRYLLSGLMKCGACGANYTKHSANRFACASARDRATCANRVTVRGDDVENAILDGLKSRLMEPALFEEFAREFITEVSKSRSEASSTKAAMQRDLERVDRQIKRLVDVIIEGGDAQAINAKLKVRDKSIDDVELVAIAQRATYANDRSAAGLRASTLGRIRGLSDQPAKRIIRNLVVRGILQDRQQPPPIRLPDGTYRSQPATDRLVLPDGPPILVRRDWTDGRLPAKQLAALLYLIAGTGLGPVVYRREIRERFGWGREAMRTVLAGLIDRGLARHVVSRQPDGTIKSQAYAAVQDVDAAIQRMQPGDGLLPVRSPPVRSEPHNRRVPSTENPLYEPTAFTNHMWPHPMGEVIQPPAELRPPAAPTAVTPPDSDSSAAQPPNPRQDDVLLGWITDRDEAVWGFGSLDIDDEIAIIREDYPDDKLRALVKRATGGRVRPKLLTAGGMEAVRFLAAVWLARGREGLQASAELGNNGGGDSSAASPEWAMRVILGGMWDRWGSRRGDHEAGGTMASSNWKALCFANLL